MSKNDHFYLKKDTLKVFFIKSLLRMDHQEDQYLEDIEGSWQQTWRMGS